MAKLRDGICGPWIEGFFCKKTFSNSRVKRQTNISLRVICCPQQIACIRYSETTLTLVSHVPPPARPSTREDDSTYELSSAQFHPIKRGIVLSALHSVNQCNQQAHGEQRCLPHGEERREDAVGRAKAGIHWGVLSDSHFILNHICFIYSMLAISPERNHYSPQHQEIGLKTFGENNAERQKQERFWLSGKCCGWSQKSSWLSNHRRPLLAFLSYALFVSPPQCPSVTLFALLRIAWRSLSIHLRDHEGATCLLQMAWVPTEEIFTSHAMTLQWLISVVNLQTSWI